MPSRRIIPHDGERLAQRASDARMGIRIAASFTSRKIDIVEDRQSRFQAEQIRKSIRTFRDYSGDLLRSDLSTFADRLQALMYFCRTDPVFATIHQQLVNNPNVDGNEWLQKQGETARLSGL